MASGGSTRMLASDTLAWMSSDLAARPDPEHRLTRRFFRLAALNVLSNLMVPLAGVVDMAILGHLPQIHALAGVALATVLFDYLYWTFGFLRMGTTGMTAQAQGRGDPEEVRSVLLRGITVAGVVGASLLIFQGPIREFGFWLLRGEAIVEASGRAYFDARIWGAPAALVNFVMLGWFLGREQSGRALGISLVGHGSNIALDYLFIVGMDLDARGAGLATMLSQYAMLVTSLYLARGELGLEALPRRWRRAMEREALGATGSLNLDILIRTFFLLTAFGLFTNLGAAFGTTVLAANAILMKVVSLAAYGIDGFAFATESLAGALVGAGRGRAIRRLLALAGGVSVLTALVFVGLFLGFPEPLFGIFTDHPDLLREIDRFAPWLAPVLGFGAIAFVLDGYFLGATQGPILRRASMRSTGLGFVPVAGFAWLVGENHLLWFAMVTFMVARVSSLAVHVPSTLRELDGVASGQPQ